MSLDFGKKQGCAGIVVTSTVFKIEPIGFQQNVKSEHGYQTAISDFKCLKISKIGKNICFPKIFKKFFEFLKTEIYVQEHLQMNICTQFQAAIFKNG